MSFKPDIFEDKGQIWVDTGHADVGPFDSKEDAQAHIDRMAMDKAKKEGTNDFRSV